MKTGAGMIIAMIAWLIAASANALPGPDNVCSACASHDAHTETTAHAADPCCEPAIVATNVALTDARTASLAGGVTNWATKLFDTSDFPRRWNCGDWTPFHGWMHVISDIAIWGAYMSIPVLLIFYIRRRNDVPFAGIFLLFAAFILACGTGHLIEAGIFWWPVYRVSGLSKAITAVVSWATVLALIPVIPKALELPGLARVNDQLNRELELRKRAETSLEARNAELTLAKSEMETIAEGLRQSNHDLEQYAYAASHDLKAPLRGIDNIVQWIEEDLEHQLSGEVRENIDLLRGRVKRMEVLLDDLLAYSRAGRTDTEIIEVDVAALIAEVIELTDIPPTFDVRVEGDLPRFHTAGTPLKLVLMNLVGNAVKHHDRDAGFIRIAVADAGPVCEFTVEDDGPGIPPKHWDRAFRMFQTLRPRDEVEGSGIGLALVKKLVESQGGEVRIAEGRGGRGTIFTVTWPREAPATESN